MWETIPYKGTQEENQSGADGGLVGPSVLTVCQGDPAPVSLGFQKGNHCSFMQMKEDRSVLAGAGMDLHFFS